MRIKEIAKKQYEISKKNGFYPDNLDILDALADIKGEVDEAIDSWCDNEDEQEFSLELADIVLRTLSLAQHLDINIEHHIIEKMNYNETRPYLHKNEKK